MPATFFSILADRFQLFLALAGASLCANHGKVLADFGWDLFHLVFIGCLSGFHCNGDTAHWAFLYFINVLSEYGAVDRAFVIALTCTCAELILGDGLAHFFLDVF